MCDHTVQQFYKAAVHANRPSCYKLGRSLVRWVCLYVRPSVCLSVNTPIPQKRRVKTSQNFLSLDLHVICGRCSVPLWRQCNALCTSGFVDDVMFSHGGLSVGHIISRGVGNRTTSMSWKGVCVVWEWMTLLFVKCRKLSKARLWWCCRLAVGGVASHCFTQA